ncbi:MAG: hypothetical protein ACRER1_06875 [Gammaproteobacteria bacterium]
MIVRIMLALSLGVLSSACTRANNTAFVLPPYPGAALLLQCSRSTPEGTTDYWKPTYHDIAELEKRLVPFLKSTPSGSAVLPLTKYHRQYVGFVKDGKRYIYGNFYTPSADIKNEASRPVVTCDGGKHFWGVVYSMETKSFSDLQFNGEA